MRRWMGVGLGMAVLAAAGLGLGTARARAAEERDRDGNRRVERKHFVMFSGGAHLGVTLDEVSADDVARLKLDEEQGALVKSVAEDSPAAKAGLQKGDVVVRYQGETVHSAAQLARLVRETPSGRKVSVEISRDGAEQRLTATLEGGRGHHPFAEDFNFEMAEPPDPPDAPEPPDAAEAPRPPRPPRAPHAPHAPGAMGRLAIPFPPEMGNLDFKMEGLFPPDADVFREVFRAGRPRRLGISYEELGSQLAAYFKAPEGSVLVTQVEPEGPAARAGVKAGDVILRFNGKTIEGRAFREEVGKPNPAARRRSPFSGTAGPSTCASPCRRRIARPCTPARPPRSSGTIRSMHLAWRHPLSLVAAGLLAVATTSAHAATPDVTPTAANLEARRAFQDARFGMFIHWGVYSVLADGEWVMQNRRIAAADYERLPGLFNPTEFDAAAWVSLAKAAGMKYITITSKHHDGFAMYDSKISDYDIVDRTPYKKDVLRALADECHKQGLQLFFYYSQLDWHHPDYYPRGRTGADARRPDHGEWNRYLDYMDGQLRELLTGYGDIGGIWFDGWWDKPEAPWRLAQTYGLIHELQPRALVGSNHHQKPLPGEDFQMFEKDLPGGRKSEFNKDSEVGGLPLETCETINNSWGFNFNDHAVKSTRELVQYLVKAAGYDANFLLNVGPMPNGKIQPEFVERLEEVGQWTSAHGESIYGTRGGPISPRPWGVTTQKGKTVYVHVLDWPDPVLTLPALTHPVKSARLLKSGAPVVVRQSKASLTLEVPAGERDPYDTVIVLEL